MISKLFNIAQDRTLEETPMSLILDAERLLAVFDDPMATIRALARHTQLGLRMVKDAVDVAGDLPPEIGVYCLRVVAKRTGLIRYQTRWVFRTARECAGPARELRRRFPARHFRVERLGRDVKIVQC